MPLSKKEIDGLLRAISLTNETEINCEQCLAVVAEFAEYELASKSIPDSLKVVEQHLSICTECCEEYKALQLALSELDSE